MGSQTAFGPRGSASVLSKATTIAAALFMVTSLSLAIISTRTGGTGGTVLETETPQTTQTAPAQPSVELGTEAATEEVPVDMPPLPTQEDSPAPEN